MIIFISQNIKGTDEECIRTLSYREMILGANHYSMPYVCSF